MALSDYVKMVKAINRRMVDIAKNVGTTNETYQQFSNQLLTFQKSVEKGGGVVKINKTKDGYLQMSLAKNSAQIPGQLLEKFNNYQTLGEKKKIVKEKYNLKNDDEALEKIKQYQSLKDFIQQHKDDIYKVEELKTALKRKGKNSNLTDEEVANIYNIYDEFGKLKPQYDREYNPLEE